MKLELAWIFSQPSDNENFRTDLGHDLVGLFGNECCTCLHHRLRLDRTDEHKGIYI